LKGFGVGVLWRFRCQRSLHWLVRLLITCRVELHCFGWSFVSHVDVRSFLVSYQARSARLGPVVTSTFSRSRNGVRVEHYRLSTPLVDTTFLRTELCIACARTTLAVSAAANQKPFVNKDLCTRKSETNYQVVRAKRLGNLKCQAVLVES